MGLFTRTVYMTAVTLVVMSLLLDEVDARRKILRGRKTITRTYYKTSAVPAWAVIVIVGSSLIIVGGILYGILKKVMLGGTNSDSYDP